MPSPHHPCPCHHAHRRFPHPRDALGFRAGASTGWHRHGMDYVVVPMTDCHFHLLTAEGERRLFIKAGEAYARALGVEHDVRNGGDQPMSFIEIEIK